MAKPSKLMRTEVVRATSRKKVAITGTCEIGERPAQEVLVTDLGPHGCSLQGDAVGVTKAEVLVLHLGAVGPIAGRLKWAKGGALGISFDAPLAAEMVDALTEADARTKIVPLRPASAG